MEPTDAALFDRWSRAGNADAFAELVARHAGMVYATALRILRNAADAEDVTQDAFIRLSQLNRATQTSLAGWLHRVAANRAIDLLRSRQAETARTESLVHAAFISADPAWAEVEAILDEEIAALPEDLRLPIVLHFFEGKTHAAVAAELGVSRPTVTRRIQEATGTLRARLAKRGVALTAAFLTANLAALPAAAAPAALTTRLGKRLLASDAAPRIGAGAPSGMGNWMYGGLILLAASASIVIHAASQKDRPPSSPGDSPSLRLEPALRAAPLEAAAANANENETAEAVSGLSEAPIQTTFWLTCLDEESAPLPGAEVYFSVKEAGLRTAKALVQSSRTQYRNSGPLIADAEGRVPFPDFGSPEARHRTTVSAFARVPGERSGCWSAFVGSDPVDSAVTLYPSVTLRGRVGVPHGYSPREVVVDWRTAFQRAPGRALGPWFIFMEHEFSGALIESVHFPALSRFIPERDGSFAIPDVPQGAQVLVQAHGKGLGAAAFRSDELLNLGTAAIEMFPEGRIEGGLLRAETGRPAATAGYAVYAKAEMTGGMYDNSSNMGLVYAELRADGAYVIDQLPSGNYTVVLQSKSAPRADTAAVLTGVTVVEGMATTGCDLRIEPGVVVTGKILAADTGAGIRGAAIVAVSPGNGNGEPVDMAETNDDGGYSLRLPSGVSKVYLPGVEGYESLPEQGSRLLELSGIERALEMEPFVLTPADPGAIAARSVLDRPRASVSGRVVDGAGNGIANVVIGEEWSHASSGDTNEATERVPYRGATRRDGTFDVAIDAEGSHRLYFVKAGYARAELEPFRIRAGESKTIPDVVLHTARGRVAGIVVDAGGRPLAGVEVEAYSENTSTTKRTTTGADGAFHFDGLAEERISIGASHPLYRRENVVIEPNQSCVITLTGGS